MHCCFLPDHVFGQSAVLDQKNTRSVTFFNSVIKTTLLWTLLTDIRQLRTLSLVPIEEKSFYYYGHQVRILDYVSFRPQNIFENYSKFFFEK